MRGPIGRRTWDLLGARLLALGVAASATAIAAGLALWVTGVAPAAGTRLADLGVLVLMATPMIRVLVAAIEHAVARQWEVVAWSLAVLAVLLTGVVAALRLPP